MASTSPSIRGFDGLLGNPGEDGQRLSGLVQGVQIMLGEAGWQAASLIEPLPNKLLGASCCAERNNDPAQALCSLANAICSSNDLVTAYLSRGHRIALIAPPEHSTLARIEQRRGLVASCGN